MRNLVNPSDRTQIMERVARFRPDSPRQWGRMTPHGAICHLTDSFLGCMGEREVLSDVSTLLNRTLIRFVAVTVPLPWPKGVPTLPEADQEQGGTQPVDFDADLERLVDATEAFVAKMDPTSYRHPMFGHMTTAEWGRWGWRHLDHHTRQFGL